MNEPIFKSVFGEFWNDLPPVLKKHYANRPFCNDEYVAEGRLDVTCGQPLKMLAPLMRILGQIPAHTEKDVPVRVRFQSDPNSSDFHLNRRFEFNTAKAYQFRSRMRHVRGADTVEIMRFGFCWKARFNWDGARVVLSHRGYAFNLFGWLVPLPLTLLMGAGHAEEVAVDDNHFDMMTQIVHPWWGKIYGYSGRFRML
ncbi:MAG: DUF4166 domain-containing protein [Rhizobiaceae bacterium]